MLTCGKCKEEKKEEDFYYWKNKKKYNSFCKDCSNDYQKARWISRKKKVVDLFGGECLKCGYNKNMAALELHHVDPSEKEFNWSKMKLRSWEKLMEEVKKCQLLCSNCHREFHNPNQTLTEVNGENANNCLNLNKKIIEPSGECPICKDDLYGTKFCSVKCSSMDCRKVKNRPDKKELEALIKDNSWCSLGRKFNVSDNAVRKWAKIYGII